VGETAEQRLADELAQRIEDSGEPEVIRLRELRDAHLKQERLTLNRRRELQRAFEKRGLNCSLPLTDADLDEDIEVSLARVSWVNRLRRGVARPLIGGVRGVALVIGLIAAVVALYPLVQAPADPKPMSGDVNLVVAGFVDEQSESGGDGLGETLFRSLRASTRPSDDPGDPDIQVRGPAAVDPIGRAREAVQVAKENGAQIVVYGQIAHRAQGAFAVPRFYVDPRLLTGAEELGGDFSLPAIDMGDEEMGGSIAGRARLRTVVSEDFHAFASFATGLGWFGAARWEHALAWFERSEDEWQAGDGAALSSLFVGNTAGKLGKFQAAEAAYLHALELEPELARAELGLTEIELHRASSDCSDTSDDEALEAVASEFSRLYEEAGGSGLPKRAFLLRARLGEARANLCLGLGGLPPGAEAAGLGFEEVLQRGAGTRSFNAELAEARAGLGLSALGSAGEDQDRGSYLHARAEYRHALQLTNDPARAQEFARIIDLIDARLYQTVWSRTDPLPAGVRAEVEFYGVGDSVCGPVIPDRPEILLDQRPFYQFELVEGSEVPELGETLSFCPRGLSISEPVVLSIRGPNGFAREEELGPTDNDLDRYVSYWLGREWPPGQYHATASQGDRTVDLQFRVALPLHKGVRMPITVGRPRPFPLPVMVVGQRPNSIVTVDVYRDPGDPRIADEEHLRYATSFELRTDEDGVAETRLPTKPEDEGAFLLRVRGLGSYDNLDLVAWSSLCDGGEC
jgi:tetratricopeptide (TPR) repeat protein